jgi:hypothetical protein
MAGGFPDGGARTAAHVHHAIVIGEPGALGNCPGGGARPKIMDTAVRTYTAPPTPPTRSATDLGRREETG